MGCMHETLEANVEFRHSALSLVETVIMPFEVREGMQREEKPETDLTRHHHDLEEGDWLESSAMRFASCCFRAGLIMMVTLVVSLIECTKVALSHVSFLY